MPSLTLHGAPSKAAEPSAPYNHFPVRIPPQQRFRCRTGVRTPLLPRRPARTAPSRRSPALRDSRVTCRQTRGPGAARRGLCGSRSRRTTNRSMFALPPSLTEAAPAAPPFPPGSSLQERGPMGWPGVPRAADYISQQASPLPHGSSRRGRGSMEWAGMPRGADYISQQAPCGARLAIGSRRPVPGRRSEDGGAAGRPRRPPPAPAAVPGDPGRSHLGAAPRRLLRGIRLRAGQHGVVSPRLPADLPPAHLPQGTGGPFLAPAPLPSASPGAGAALPLPLSPCSSVSCLKTDTSLCKQMGRLTLAREALLSKYSFVSAGFVGFGRFAGFFFSFPFLKREL